MGARKLTGAEEAAIAQRRSIVAASLLAGLNYRDIAAQTNYSLGTIASDVKYLRRQWLKEQLRDVQQMIAQNSRRIDVLLNGIWERAVGTPGQKPDMAAIEEARKLIAEQRALLGLVTPRQIEVETRTPIKVDLSGATDEQLDRLAASLKG